MRRFAGGNNTPRAALATPNGMNFSGGGAASGAPAYTPPAAALQPQIQPVSAAAPSRLPADFDAAAFERIPFQIEVGGQDVRPEDAPRAWDPYLGTTRVARAQAYATALTAMGMQVALRIYPATGHGVTPPMRDDALAFLQAAAERAAGPPPDSGAHGQSQAVAPQPAAARKASP